MCGQHIGLIGSFFIICGVGNAKEKGQTIFDKTLHRIL
jgi:hypothetical protein